jgi:hypothetical protein
VALRADVVCQQAVASFQYQPISGCGPDLRFAAEEDQKAAFGRRMQVLRGGGLEKFDHPYGGCRNTDEPTDAGDAFGVDIDHWKLQGRQMGFARFVSMHTVERHVADYMI